MLGGVDNGHTLVINGMFAHAALINFASNATRSSPTWTPSSSGSSNCSTRNSPPKHLQTVSGRTGMRICLLRCVHIAVEGKGRRGSGLILDIGWVGMAPPVFGRKPDIPPKKPSLYVNRDELPTPKTDVPRASPKQEEEPTREAVEKSEPGSERPALEERFTAKYRYFTSSHIFRICVTDG